MHQPSMLPPFYGDGDDELHLAFNLPWLHSEFDAETLRSVVEETERILPTGAWPVWTGSNLDTSRLATRWAGGHPGRIRCVLLALLTLRGTPVIYQGDEIGLPDGVLDPGGPPRPDRPALLAPRHRARPRALPPALGRRTGTRLHRRGVDTWLPMGTPPECNVAAQRARPGVGPHLHPRPHRPPPVGPRPAPPVPTDASFPRRHLGVATRAPVVATALNLGRGHSRGRGHWTGSVALATDRGRDGQPVSGRLALRRPGPRGRSVRLRPERRGGPRFVLIHGGFHGAWCWSRTIPELETSATKRSPSTYRPRRASAQEATMAGRLMPSSPCSSLGPAVGRSGGDLESPTAVSSAIWSTWRRHCRWRVASCRRRSPRRRDRGRLRRDRDAQAPAHRPRRIHGARRCSRCAGAVLP